MIHKYVKKIAKDIKNIKIQGASNIELEAIKAILYFLEQTNIDFNKKQEFFKELKENINHLVSQRPNEPKLRNSMNYILVNTKKLENKQELIETIKKYDENTKKGNKLTSDIASNMINNGTKILTHCHSQLVEDALKKAYDRGVDFEVYCTETRPRYQGHITAKNLSDYGLKVTMIVDSAVSHILKKIDYFFTGADVIFSDGSLLNKVGTHTISLMANNFKTPHIVLTTTHCCEVNDLLNAREEIEERDADEIWEKEKRPKNLNIKNPAFDLVPNQLIDKFITEEGVFSPESLYIWVNQKK
jgi:ribose 1,5-bisphosphate isomerase